ncbi:hypothetical protein PC129_g16036 [Phytophthora cactorum]|uniref:DUF6604 domain-containing protein n=1 Tax=Phytophthora cactorum TaxID=29920 RepID=A0A329RGB9_9STRA|nr:hypothetical protein Pcac1_g2467 [Phytophthora cactorum]KAG2813301.1 hypothetical protein PC112_g14797 [Phytophthora cactorum]KAG2814856.1 hypothetical protein PC111_g13793 [Phytophthora cactorum]KAG2852436.1 hypothetical protein PC113_g15022 [Phytophthora cactorum]KAG2923707.1 hypothetical protein PC117_g15653 [Phytophthora cactorum]
MSCFPTGKYARYKRATAYFLNWLVRARGPRRDGKQFQLETFSHVVKEIAANPSTLTPKLRQGLPKALAACQYAIVLREHVASFFPEHDEGQAGHQYFMQLLRSWHGILKTVEVGQTQAAVQSESADFENYYEVLDVDDDFLPDEDSYEAKVERPQTAIMNKNRLFEEAFGDEMKMEVACFCTELDELMQGVCKVYGQVKREERTLVEVTVVAKLAMDSASALTAQLQLKYSALRTSEDLYNVVRNIDPDKFRQRMAAIHTKYLTDLQESLLNGDGAIPYVPGMFLMDFLGVGTTLASFLTALPIDSTKSIKFPTGCFGEAYGEDRTPHYVLLPDPSKSNVFLLQQLPLLHKTIVEKKVTTGSGYDSSAPMDSFMVLMEKYFTTREVTVPVVFACICWMKSVVALQGDAGLGRNVSLTFKHSTELMRNIETTVAKGNVRNAHKKSNNVLQLCADEIKRSTGHRYLSRANPLLAGLTMLDHHFKYLHMASEILLVTSRFRSFGHVYNALVKEGYLQHIPFVDDILEVYSEMIYAPSREAATRGSYYRSLLLSVDLRSTSVDAVCRGETLPAGNEKFKKRKVFHLSDVSETYQLMVKNDKSRLKHSSWAAILDGAANVCSKELFETRVLSRDLLKLNDELANVYFELCGELKAIAGSMSGQNQQQQKKMEDGVIMVLLQLLDGGETVEAADMCKKAAAVVRKTFATPPTAAADKYFTFPSQPDFVTQEYGSHSVMSSEEKDNREQMFSKLMKLLQTSNGPLARSTLRYLKLEIKKDRQLLGMTVPTLTRSGTIENGTNASDDSLCTLLHHAAAGSAHDAELVEWMIQMGALAIQPTLHCRKDPPQNEVTCSQVLLPNDMAVHGAAIAGYEDIVQIILEADTFVDLNTPTLHTRETLAHLAVKHGHRSLFNTLVWFGADLLVTDRRGRRVCDMTTDADWARDIAAYTGSTFNSVGKRENYLQENERRRKLAAVNCDEQGTSVLERTSPRSTKRSKKRSNKKKIKKGRTSDRETTTPAATGTYPIFETNSHLLHCLHTSPPPSSRCY